MLGLMAVLLMAVLAQLILLQIADVNKGPEYLKKAGDARALRVVKTPASRGAILDRNGRALAISSPVKTLWLDPQRFDFEAHGVLLAKIVGLDVAQFRAKFERNSAKSFLYVQKHLPPNRVESLLADLKLGNGGDAIPGLHWSLEAKRFYPTEAVASHLLGFTDSDLKGLAGLEKKYDENLSGAEGSRRVLQSRTGQIIKNIEQIAPVSHGDDLHLSIDLRLQYYAHKELNAAVEYFKARSGSVVVLDVQTNEVLALVNEPTFDPNNRRDMRADKLLNRAVTRVIEPGSTVKPLTMVAALESGQYRPDTIVDTGPGYLDVAGKVLSDHRNYGELSIADVLKKSSQVGTSKVALALGGNTIREVMHRFGFGQALDVGFPAETSGLLPDYSNWHPHHTVTMAYGYGLAVSPLQLAQAYSVLANRGLHRPVTLLRTEQPPQARRIVQPEIAAAVVQMLSRTVEEGGTGTRARIPHFTVAGKTGTVHRLADEGYAEDRYVSIFAGFAPVGNPRLVAVVVVDDPRGDAYFGGEVAAPVFSRVVGESLRLLNVQPDAPGNVPMMASVAKEAAND